MQGGGSPPPHRGGEPERDGPARGPDGRRNNHALEPHCTRVRRKEGAAYVHTRNIANESN